MDAVFCPCRRKSIYMWHYFPSAGTENSIYAVFFWVHGWPKITITITLCTLIELNKHSMHIWEKCMGPYSITLTTVTLTLNRNPNTCTDGKWCGAYSISICADGRKIASNILYMYILCIFLCSLFTFVCWVVPCCYDKSSSSSSLMLIQTWTSWRLLMIRGGGS